MIERPFLYACHLDAAALAAALARFEAHFRYLYLESETTVELLDYDPAHLDGATWSVGRAFGPALEVRWQPAGGGLDLLLLTEADIHVPESWHALTEETAGVPVPDAWDRPSQIMLWGTHIDHLQHPHRLAGEEGQAWIETRIPRPLAYPVPGRPRNVRARVIVYRCRGRPLLTRLADLEGEDREPQPLW